MQNLKRILVYWKPGLDRKQKVIVNKYILFLSYYNGLADLWRAKHEQLNYPTFISMYLKKAVRVTRKLT